MSHVPLWEELLVSDVLDIAALVASGQIDQTREYSHGYGSGTVKRIFDFKYPQHQIVHNLEVAGSEKLETVIVNGLPTRKNLGFISVVSATFGYEDSSAGESVTITPSVFSQRSFEEDVSERRIAEHTPWAEPCIMPLVRLHFLGSCYPE